jgi:two-component system, OmpR family, sensor histidine kinase MprB
MTLRHRIVAVASVAVALSVFVAALVLYLAVRSELRGEIDQSLRERSHSFLPVGGGPAGRRQPLPGLGIPNGYDQPDADDVFPKHVPQVPPLKEAGIQVEFISPQGAVEVPGGQGGPYLKIAPATHEKAIARDGRGSLFSERTIKGTRLRILTVGAGSRGAVLVARSLGEVNHELSHILLILVLIAIGGVILAAVIGALVARTALAPIARFTRRTESLTGKLDLSQRLEVSGRDELARLAESFNLTLDALEQSLQAQRHLVADASHELRTPMASLRANIQTLEDAERLPPEEQAALRRDIIEELDELTALVSDVVELARGTKTDMSADELRLDEIVREAVKRTGRRGDLRLQVELEPTVVRGQADRVSRAVSNLLDNARKWSSEGGVVEVDLHDGLLSVRDHGPGFNEPDLPFVFDRFYRAEGARKLPGSGLGLAIVRQAAEASGGYVKADNAEGGGALLQVSFGTAISFVPAADDT